MRHNVILNIILAAVFIAVPACSPVTQEQGPEESEKGFTISFMSPVSDDVVVSTRTVHELYVESTVNNLYVYLVGPNGRIYTKQFYDNTNLKDNEDAVRSATSGSSWYVKNMTRGDNSQTEGVVCLPAPEMEDCKIVAIANISPDVFTLSKERLDNECTDFAGLQNFIVELNLDITARNGYFPMSGMIENVSVKKDGFDFNGGDGILHLVRIDAKIEFEVTIETADNYTDDPGQKNYWHEYTYYDENGNPINAKERILSFAPTGWRVVNAPRSTYMLGYGERGIAAEHGYDSADVLAEKEGGSLDDYFFSTGLYVFDKITDNGTELSANPSGGSFGFYLLPNRRPAKKTIPKDGEINPINLRSKQRKNADGTYIEKGSFEYADDYATYVEIKGVVTMDVSGNGDEKGKTINGDVVYMIHLGDFAKNPDDFNIKRNTNYRFKVKICGLHAIRVEVETSDPDGAASEEYGYNLEKNSGAAGTVNVCNERLLLCDAHYVTKTLTFRFSNISEGLTWYVKTPFCEGSPDPVTNSAAGCADFKWLHFRLNKLSIAQEKGQGIDQAAKYVDTHRKYITRPWEYYARDADHWHSAGDNKEGDGTDGCAGYNNDGLMTIEQLVSYLKRQKALCTDASGNYVHGVSDFAYENGPGSEPNIKVTVFVDEYYYEIHPITGANTPDLWKLFVNQDDRYASILSQSMISSDLDSKVIGSAVTIQQHSIQSIYNTDRSNTALTSAWGLEREDEYAALGKYWTTYNSENRDNNSNTNGLLNTVKEWGLWGKDSFSSKAWSSYVDFEVGDDIPQLIDTYRYQRYNCMTRNRDNNGNGKIDENEVRWYMASINQLIGIFIGNGVVNPNARLYNRTQTQQKSDKPTIWRQHVVSSTSLSSNSNNPIVVWAEEGVATGGLKDSDVRDNVTVRCLRNLGDAAITKEPADFIKVSEQANSVLFDATNLNEGCFRYYTFSELPLANHYSEENKIYRKFECSKDKKTSTSADFQGINTAIDNSTGGNPYCPEGYRLPNQKELTIMKYFSNMVDDGPVYISRTAWAFGPWGGSDLVKETKYGFCYSGGPSGNITLATINTNTARCVRDVR